MDAVVAARDLPLNDQQADALLDGLTGRALLLAVSGGADSIAMMGTVALWAKRKGEDAPRVAVVDHGLREGSAAEAAFVVQSAENLGLSCSVLSWRGAKPASGLQNAAREARYGLLVAHAADRSARTLVTAHTLDDQAETVMMRMAGGSGITGLAGMRGRSVTRGMEHARPFLSVPKATLVATCLHRRWDWVEDPSNLEQRFARVRWRALMPVLAREGLDAKRLATLARRAAEADEALHAMSQEALRAARFSTGPDGWSLDAATLAERPFAVSVRVIALALKHPESQEEAAFDAYSLRLDRLERLTRAIIDQVGAGAGLRASLAGQVLTLGRAARLSGRMESVRSRGRVNRVRISDLGKAPGET